MSNTPKLENHYNKLLQDIMLKTLEQNQIVETYLIQEDFSSTLDELQTINAKLEEYCKVFALLERIKTELAEEDKVYN
ncbi:hypothetical protein [Rickettsia rickettsii]|uniref:Uncharacterized protein n=2 Tax=Rickettsia rickettsii TaxID=783 RepID=B0BUM9_RICRO|nr:hypothetical protein [Rickettsia rickettsii]ABV76563.1 hypothetical protein A1G_05400 [Rickettsia rickettsii str. 'Sheila Smith']ABY72939.1 hypothetical protein RrIowa_1163 [Rickettsia rickettsii str. Iowa]AFB21865.1 hypothetical protein RPN_01580 [Rickettsia rickettsii str. Brazil]AFB23915.1 hypothetical protein RPL_05445 [Rickettsia rickettsii str. Colombia]AFB25261.1 hypothetical protein RPO_05465 [Rickettsia rickettsii str. Arizona]